MPKKISAIHFANLLCALLVASSLFAADLHEPDNTYSTATPISLGTPQDHDLDPAGDLDFVSFTATAGTHYLLEINETVPGGVLLTLFDTDGTSPIRNKNTLFGPRLHWSSPGNGTYFISITGQDTNATGPYTLTLTSYLPNDVSGKVNDSVGSPVLNGEVEILTGNPCGTSFTTASVFASTDGTYTIAGLPDDTYYLQASALPDGHIPEWWTGAADDSSPDCNQAVPITVSGGRSYPDKNFQLDPGAHVSGTVLNKNGGPIAGNVMLVTGDPCGTPTPVASVGINPANGVYSLSTIPPGTYYLVADAAGNYVTEWWAGPTAVSSPDCTQARALTLAAGQDERDKNFQPDAGAQISGTARDSSGNFVMTGRVDILTGDPCGNSSVIGSGQIGLDGAYLLNKLPSGTYFLKAYSSGSHVNEWWMGGDRISTPDCSLAKAIQVSEGSSHTADFELDIAGSSTVFLSGTVKDSNGAPVTGGTVHIFTGDPCDSSNQTQAGTSLTGADGTYLLELPPGDFYLQADGAGNLTAEWWAGAQTGSDPDCGLAQLLPANVTGRNYRAHFQLDIHAKISGVVRDAAGNPTTDGGEILITSSAPCGTAPPAARASIAPDGSYTISLPPGDYFLQADSYGNYISEWWAGPATVSTPDCTSALPLKTTPAGTFNADFQLDTGATISGAITSADNGNPIPFAKIKAFSGDPCGSNSLIATVENDPANGSYTLTGLPDGTYYLQALTEDANYLVEWWAGPQAISSPDCSLAQPVSVIAGQNYTGRNFNLDTGGRILGTVFDSNDLPIPDYRVELLTGDPCGTTTLLQTGQPPAGSTDGTYLFFGLNSGTYYLRASSTGSHPVEWWTGPQEISSPDCSLAQPVNVTAGQDSTDRNFNLDTNARIKGTVLDSSGNQIVLQSLPDGTPLIGPTVRIYTGDPCGTYTQKTGIMITGPTVYFLSPELPAGTYYLQAEAGNGYAREWWTGETTESSADCREARPVTLTFGQKTTFKNFRLDQAAQISGLISDRAGNQITGTDIQVTAYIGDPCGTVYPIETYTFVQGAEPLAASYNLKPLPAETLYLRANTLSGNWQAEWWTGGTNDSSPDCAQAQSINVTEGQVYSGRNFKLDIGSQISGTVRDDNGTPLSGKVMVKIFTGAPCSSAATAGETTMDPSDGTYLFQGLGNGAYFLQASGDTYSTEWWAGGTGTGSSSPDCAQAQSVTVTAGQSYGNRDFSLDRTFLVTPSSGMHGSITPADPVTVTAGSVASFTLTPEPHYSVQDVTGTCPPGTLADNGNNTWNYRTGSITANCDVLANFAIMTYTISASVTNGNGTINPSGDQMTNHGETRTFTLSPAQGYHIAQVTGTCGGTLTGNLFTTNAITSDCTVLASFANTYTLRVIFAGTGSGTVTSSSPGINNCTTGCSAEFSPGTPITLTAAADPGNIFTAWSGSGCSGTDPCAVTMDRNRDITVTFRRNSFPWAMFLPALQK